MTDNTKNTEALSRRKALRRIGLMAASAYAVPAFTTLSMAQAGSNASTPSAPKPASTPSAPETPSTPSVPSGPTTGTGTGTTTGGTVTPADIQKACGVEDLTNPTYVQCVIDNGGTDLLPAGFVLPDGVVLR